MTTLTDAELFCLRYLEREGAKKPRYVVKAFEVEAGKTFGAMAALGSLLDLKLIEGSPCGSVDFPAYSITPAGRAELERREEKQ